MINSYLEDIKKLGFNKLWEISEKVRFKVEFNSLTILCKFTEFGTILNFLEEERHMIRQHIIDNTALYSKDIMVKVAYANDEYNYIDDETLNRLTIEEEGVFIDKNYIYVSNRVDFRTLIIDQINDEENNNLKYLELSDLPDTRMIIINKKIDDLIERHYYDFDGNSYDK